MRTIVNGVKMDLGETLKTHAESGLDATVSKFFPDYIEAKATFTKLSGGVFSTQVNVHPEKGVMMSAKSKDANPYVAFEKASEKIEAQLRKKQQKRNKRPDINILQQFIAGSEQEAA